MVSDAIMGGLLQIMTRCTSKDSGGVMEEALMAVSSLIEGTAPRLRQLLIRRLAMGTGFAKYMEQFKPFLFAGLNNHEDSQVCLSAIGVISDLCRAFEENLFPMCDEIVQTLNHILEVSLLV